MSQSAGNLFRAHLLLGVSAGALLMASPALAQTQAVAQPDVPPANQQAVPPTDDQKQAAQIPPQTTVPSSGGDTAATENPNTIVVTGTRIRQPEFTSPDPVARIDPVIAQQQGKLDTADMLQSSPIAAGSTQITSAISSNFVTNGGPGSETIDLRGLGPNRTLVLLNGRRAGPAGTRGGVSSFDLNVLPQSIVKQVDILKTGASSIYGSDAIAGVVNLITKTDFNGLQFDGFVSAPLHTGGEQESMSVLWGKASERGHVMVALDYFHNRELTRGDRSYLGCPEAYVFRKGTNQRADLIDPRTGKYHCEDFPSGQVWTYDYEYNYLGAPGNLRLADGTFVGPVNLIQYFPPGGAFGLPPISGCGVYSCFNAPAGFLPTGYNPASYAVQNDYNQFIPETTIVPDTKRYTLYADAAYHVTDGIEAYAEFLANRRKTYQNGWRQFWTFGFSESGSYYGNYGSYWAKGWTGLNFLSPTPVTDRGSDSKQQVDYWRGVGGIRGNLPGFLRGWTYDAYVQHSHNKGLYSSEQILQDALDMSSFQTQSCVGQITPISHRQCVDIPWLSPSFLNGEIPADVANFLFQWETGSTIYNQTSIEGSATGNLINLPAGPVGVAIGATGRRDSILDTPGPITLAGNAWGNTGSGITQGHEITTEAFGEIRVPLLKDRNFFRDLSFNGATRLTNVKAIREPDGLTENNKGNWTYKLGGNWAPMNWLRFRGTYGTSFRAPALFEEFKANETAFISARTIDPCVEWAFNLAQGNIDQRTAQNCAAAGIPPNYGGGSITATVFSQGGIGTLKPETSKAKTASIILTPSFSFLPRTKLSLAVDWFDIVVKGEISQLGAQTIVFGCYDSPNYPNDPLCSLFDRGTLGTDPYALSHVHDKYINIATQKNSGLDFTGVIQHDLGPWGSFNLLANATYQLKDSIVLLPGSPAVSNNGDIGDPKFVAQLNASWKPHGGWIIFWGTEIYGSASNEQKFKERHGGSLCQTSVIWGDYCVHLKVPTTFYHAASVTKRFPENGIEFTLGVRNIFDTKPPRVSTIGGAGLPAEIGPVVGTSQYDLIGRRVFFNLTKKF